MPATAFVRGGFWPENGVSTMAQAGGQNQLVRRLGMTFSRNKGAKVVRGLMFKLNGAAPGANAFDTDTLVSSSEELGGKRAIEQKVILARPTTAADVTMATWIYWYSELTYTVNPVPNLDRNPLGTR